MKFNFDKIRKLELYVITYKGIVCYKNNNIQVFESLLEARSHRKDLFDFLKKFSIFKTLKLKELVINKLFGYSRFTETISLDCEVNN